jgi:hypothetical protein
VGVGVGVGVELGAALGVPLGLGEVDGASVSASLVDDDPVPPCWRPENEVTTIPEMAALGRQAESSPRRVGRERLRPDIAPGTLHAVRVWETRKNWAECTRGD